MNTMEIIESGRRKRLFRHRIVTTALFVLTVTLCIAVLLLGNTIYPADIVWRALWGEEIKGASFAVTTLRLPRMLAGLFAGFAFGMAGSVFQTMLRNPMASPNVIGVTAGSSVAAVFCILVLSAGKATTSLAAVIAGLLTTALIYFLSQGGGFSGGKLILIGIGVQAMLNALISFMLLKGASHDVPTAMRWLSGSLNAVQMKDLPALLSSVLLISPIIILLGRQLNILELGEQSAITLGVQVNKVRLVLVLGAVLLLAFATAATGPIAFVAFLAGPISKRLVGIGFSYELPAGLTGAVLVLASDLIAQFAFPVKYPVGVITGIIGAPYLIFLLVRMNKVGDA